MGMDGTFAQHEERQRDRSQDLREHCGQGLPPDVNINVMVELPLALLIAQGDALTSLLGTVALSGTQWLIGAVPAVLLFVLWELGKLIARHGAENRHGARSRGSCGRR